MPMLLWSSKASMTMETSQKWGIKRVDFLSIRRLLRCWLKLLNIAAVPCKERNRIEFSFSVSCNVHAKQRLPIPEKKRVSFQKETRKHRCMANCPEAMRPYPSPPCCAVCLCGCGRMMPFGRRMRQKHALHIWMVTISLYLMSLGLAFPCVKGLDGKFMCWLGS